jgi:hypothetical protein
MEDFVDHFVTLDGLPDGLRFPPEFADRIHFDPDTRRLTHRGFMSKVEFDRLCGLSDHWGYRRQLEELFRLCTPEESSRPRGLRRIFAPLASLGLF